MDPKKEFYHRNIKQETESELYSDLETFINGGDFLQVKSEDPAYASRESQVGINSDPLTITYAAKATNVKEYKSVPRITTASSTAFNFCRLCAEVLVRFVQNDGLSSFICTKCQHDLYLVEKFVNRVVNADKTMRERYNLQDVKTSAIINSSVLNVQSKVILNETVNTNETYHKQQKMQDSSLLYDKKVNMIADKQNLAEETEAVEKTAKRRQVEPIQMETSQTDKCRKCMQQCAYYGDFVEHVKTQNVTNRSCPEEGCSETFPTAKAVHQHIVDYHNAPVVCHVCKKIFSNRKFLKKHQERSHSSKVCQVCGMLFNSNISFEKHVTLHQHEHENRYSCVYCQKKFNSKWVLQRHTRQCHTGHFSLLVDTSEEEES